MLRSASEGLAVAAASSPAFALFYFLDGLLVARFPRDAAPPAQHLAPASALHLPPLRPPPTSAA